MYAVVTNICDSRPRCAITDLVRSADGGRTWSRIPGPPHLSMDARVAFADARDGWVAASGYTDSRGSMYTTHDGGMHWHRVAIAPVHGLLVADARVYVVTGAIPHAALWSSPADRDAFVRLGPAAGDTLTSAAGVVYAYLDKSPVQDVSRLTVASTTRFDTLGLPCRHTFSVAFAAENTRRFVVVCGGEPGTGNQLKTAYASVDGGRTWQRIPAPGFGGYVEVGAAGAAGVFMTGDRMPVVQSRNERAWPTALLTDGDGFSDVAFVDRIHGVVVGEGYGLQLFLTDNGGRTWRRSVPVPS